MLISAEHISINFGSRQLLSDVDFYLNEGDKVGVIGVNGTGKSTLLGVLAGTLEPDAGKVSRDPNVQVSVLSQNPAMDDGATVLEQVFLSFSPEYRALNEYEARSMLSKLGITDTEQKIGTLSGGQRKRVALATALLHPADVLILDEPTNHLDTDMVTWLEERLRKFRGGLVMVTHDRYFLERVTDHITEVSRGKLYHYEGNYSRYLELKTEREEMAEASERKRRSILRVEREWIMRGCQARSTKSKDRIRRYEELKAQSGPETDEAVTMATASSRLGRKTIRLENVSKAYGGRYVVRDFTCGILRDDRIGIVGRNGAGKSTLLRMIAGDVQPDAGYVDMGATVRIGHFSQEGRELDPDQRVYDFIHSIADELRTDEGVITANAMMERFLFTGDLQSRPIGRLSGGERRRLYLLSVLMIAPNILLLDEPTNDLDVTTLAILEDYLQTFPGAVLTVSHDRWFLDKLADTILEVREGGEVFRCEGNWTDWWEKYRKPQPETAAPEKPKAAAEKPREKKLKFTFREQKEFETIDADIASLEEQIAGCDWEMESCGSDYVRLQQLTEQRTELEHRLEEKTERWLYLTELKEQIDAQS